MLGLRLNRLGAAIQTWISENLFVGGAAGALYDLSRSGFNFQTTSGLLGSTAAADPLGLVASVVNDGRGIVNKLSNSSSTLTWALGPNSTRVISAGVAPPFGNYMASAYQGNGTAGNMYVTGPSVLEANTWYTASVYSRLVSGVSPSDGRILSQAYHNGTIATRANVLYSDVTLTSDWQRFEVPFFNVVAGTYSTYAHSDTTSTSVVAIFGGMINKGVVADPYQHVGPYLGGPLSLGQSVAGSRPTLGSYPRGGVRNQIRNNTMVGASAPNTTPTNWTVDNTENGLTRSIALSTVNGIECIDITWSGTTIGTGALDVFFENANVPTYAAGVSVTLSNYVALIAGDLTGISQIRLLGYAYNSGVGFLSTAINSSDIKASISSTLARLQATGTTPASTASVRPLIAINYTTGQAVNFTIRIGLPQLELGSAATPVQETYNSNFLVSETGVPQIETAYFDGGDWMTTGTTTLENKTDGLGIVNYNKYTNRLKLSAWNVQTTVTVTEGVEDPDGGNTAFTITAGGTDSVFGQTFTDVIGSEWCGSWWIRRRTGAGNVAMRVADNTNQVLTTLSSSWQRLSETDVASGTTIRNYIVLTTSGDEVDVWHPQINPGATPDDYQGNDGTLGGSAGSASLACVPDQEWTVGFVWASTSSAAQYLFAKASSSAASHTLSVLLEGGVIKVRAMGSAQIVSSGGLADGVPHTGMIVWNGTTGTLYIDGSAPQTLTIGTAAEEVSELITIGCRTASSPAVFYTGTVDNLLLEARALSASEANQWLSHQKAQRGTP